MSTRSSVYNHDPGDGSTKIHIFFEHMTDRYEMEISGLCFTITIALPNDFVKQFMGIANEQD